MVNSVQLLNQMHLTVGQTVGLHPSEELWTMAAPVRQKISMLCYECYH